MGQHLPSPHAHFAKYRAAKNLTVSKSTSSVKCMHTRLFLFLSRLPRLCVLFGALYRAVHTLLMKRLRRAHTQLFLLPTCCPSSADCNVSSNPSSGTLALFLVHALSARRAALRPQHSLEEMLATKIYLCISVS